MDDARFDTLTRSLTDAHSRRGALSGLLLGTFGLLGWVDTQDAVAKNCKKIEDKKKRKKCLANAKRTTNQDPPPSPPGPPAPPSCTPSCAGKVCGPDGCGGQCGRCNGACVNNTCVCPDGSHLCDGVCQACCLDFHCTGGRTCQGGTCGCPVGKRFCNNTLCRECCSNLDCCDELTNQLTCETTATSCANGTCGCTGGRVLLANRSCAQVCPSSNTCGLCSCGSSIEGTMHCTQPFLTCNDVPPQTCTSTAQCPQGSHCQSRNCGPGMTMVNRCFPLCKTLQ